MKQALYLIRASNGLTKIGIAHSPKRRFCMLQSASPLRLELLHMSLADDAAAIEADLHREFSGKLSHGEWFRLTDRDIDSIRSRYPASNIKYAGNKRLVLLGLTPQEYEEIKAAAAYCCLPMTQFVIQSALAASKENKSQSLF